MTVCGLSPNFYLREGNVRCRISVEEKVVRVSTVVAQYSLPLSPSPVLTVCENFSVFSSPFVR